MNKPFTDEAQIKALSVLADIYTDSSVSADEVIGLIIAIHTLEKFDAVRLKISQLKKVKTSVVV